MKNKEKLLNELAKLAVVVGANVQKKQRVVIRTSIDCAPLVHKITAQAYKVGAKSVHVVYNDPQMSALHLKYKTIEELKSMPQHIIDEYKYYLAEGACFISIVSPIPDLLDSVKVDRLNAANYANYTNLGFFSQFLSASKTQWTIVAYPNDAWAKKVFPNLHKKAAWEALLAAILQTSRVELGQSLLNWQRHNEALLNHNKILNSYNFQSLKFVNAQGTNLEVGLVKNHIWSGGGEYTTQGVYFNPNIPTEENFTMPDKFHINGKVYATLPLDYQGKLIEGFYLEFLDGKIINFHAEKNEEILRDLINTDEGSHSLGEVALVSHNSPISRLGILFYNTLFDENASCHLAIGRAYPMNILGGTKASLEELSKVANISKVHVDFMFGSHDMSCIGTTPDGQKVQILVNGNFVI
ncbi:MAG: aminopeptidase [Acholeplasmatales bacterium]|nr:aminopeptidase [Acholeplasmatales bacterium]